MIKYDEAIGNLCEMFPDYDLDVIKTVLRANRGHLESTIDQLLSSRPNRSETAAAAATTKSTTSTAAVSEGSTGSKSTSNGQGFVNAPIPSNMTREEQIAYDEALAREMQRRILMAQGYSVPPARYQPQQGPMYQAQQRQLIRQQQQAYQQQQRPENYEEIDVLQDLKDSMSRMSEAAKLKFKEWWAKFSGPSVQGQGTGGANAKYSALSQSGDDDDSDDDDDEEVSFDSSTLSKRTGKSDFYDTKDRVDNDDDEDFGIEMSAKPATKKQSDFDDEKEEKKDK